MRRKRFLGGCHINKQRGDTYTTVRKVYHVDSETRDIVAEWQSINVEENRPRLTWRPDKIVHKSPRKHENTGLDRTKGKDRRHTSQPHSWQIMHRRKWWIPIQILKALPLKILNCVPHLALFRPLNIDVSSTITGDWLLISTSSFPTPFPSATVR